MVHEDILGLNPIIHAPIRLAIMSVLITAEEADFTYLKEVTQTTDGNLSTHLTKLENNGFIAIKKSFKGKKPHTTCSLTVEGKKAFMQYLDQMEQIIEIKNK